MSKRRLETFRSLADHTLRRGDRSCENSTAPESCGAAANICRVFELHAPRRRDASRYRRWAR